MGSGDWNDGMNRVGIAGRGESVWLGFFRVQVLSEFGKLAQGQSDAEFARLCAQQAEGLGENLEEHGWDGAWYRRAWFDDGMPLSTASADACRIDSIAQNWSVLFGGAVAKRAPRQAMT